MAEEQNLLTASVRANLGDKSLDKRKQAASDVEQAVRSLLRGASAGTGTEGAFAGYGASAGSTASAVLGAVHEQIARLTNCLAEDYCRSAFPNRRKGGLMGLASMAIALNHQPAQRHVAQLVEPVLTCFSDEDASVRYSACEAFYNIAKVVRGGILPKLRAVFDGLCRLYTDVDQSVKDGAQCLDRLVRDVVTEQRDFDYSTFIPLLTERIRVLNPSVRQLVLAWIVLLDSLPQVDMIVYLPQYLEGLFGILASDNRDIRHNAEVCLAELLDEIRSSAGERPARAQRAVAEAASTVARCCRSGERRPEDNYVRLMALHWLLEFVKLQVDLEHGVLAAAAVAPAAAAENASSPRDAQLNASQRLKAASWLPPRAAATALTTSVLATADGAASSASQGGLRQLVPELLSGALYCLDDGEGEIRQNAEQANAQLREAARSLGSDLPVEPIADAVLEAMRDGVGGQERSQEVLLKCFGWAELLLSQCPVRVLVPAVRDRLLEAALAALLRPEEEVASASLRLVARLAATSDGNWACEEMDDEGEDLFGRMCRRLFRLLAEQPSMLASRGELVVRRLCDGVDAERFFATAAKAIADEKDRKFVRHLVQVLNRGLLTGRETRKLRAKLRAEAAQGAEGGTPAAESLPMVLLGAWVHCPVSSLALSLWMNWFELAAELAARLARLELTEELQAQLNEFVELLDSPVFTSVRLQLLETRRQPSLLRAVLRLVALLPEERALRARLQVVETGLLLDRVVACPRSPEKRSSPKEAEKLLARFDEVTRQHRWRDCVV